MSRPAQFMTSKDAHAAGWFSRRHRSSEAHVAAQHKRQVSPQPLRPKQRWANDHWERP